MAANAEYTLRPTNDNPSLSDNVFLKLYKIAGKNNLTAQEMLEGANRELVSLPAGNVPDIEVHAADAVANYTTFTIQGNTDREEVKHRIKAACYGNFDQAPPQPDFSTLRLDITGYHAAVGQFYGRRVDLGNTPHYCEFAKNPNVVPVPRDVDLQAFSVRSIPRLDLVETLGAVRAKMEEQGFTKNYPEEYSKFYADAAWSFINEKIIASTTNRTTECIRYLHWLVDQHDSGQGDLQIRFHYNVVRMQDGIDARVPTHILVFANGRLTSVSVGTMAHNGSNKGKTWDRNAVSPSILGMGRYIAKAEGKNTVFQFGQPHVFTPTKNAAKPKIYGMLSYYPDNWIVGDQMRVEFFGNGGSWSFGHIKLSTINRFFLPHALKGGWIDYLQAINPHSNQQITAKVTRDMFIVSPNPNSNTSRAEFPGAAILAPPEVFASWFEFQQILYLQKLQDTYFTKKISNQLAIIWLDGASRAFSDRLLTSSSGKHLGKHFLAKGNNGLETDMFVSHRIYSHQFSSLYYTFIASCILTARNYNVIMKFNRDDEITDEFNNTYNPREAIALKMLDPYGQMTLVDRLPLMREGDFQGVSDFTPKERKGRAIAGMLFPRTREFEPIVSPGVYPNAEGGIAEITFEQAAIVNAQLYYVNRMFGRTLWQELYTPLNWRRTIDSTLNVCNVVICEQELDKRPPLERVTEYVSNVLTAINDAQRAEEGAKYVQIIKEARDAHKMSHALPMISQTSPSSEANSSRASAAPLAIFDQGVATPAASSSTTTSSSSNYGIRTDPVEESPSKRPRGDSPVSSPNTLPDSGFWSDFLVFPNEETDTLVNQGEEAPLDFTDDPPVGLFGQNISWEEYAKDVASGLIIVSDAHYRQLQERFPELFENIPRGTIRTLNMRSRIEAAIRKRMPHRPRMAKFLAERIFQQMNKVY